METPKNNRGRPRKNIKNNNSIDDMNKRGRGRPKKEHFDDDYQNCESNLQRPNIIYCVRQSNGNLYNPINGDYY